MANYIENNRNTWFSLNEELKRDGSKPVENKKESLLQRKEGKKQEQMMSTKNYMITIRNAFKKHIESNEEI